MKIKKLSFLALLAVPFITTAGGDNFEIGAKADGLAGAAVTLSDVWSAHNNQAGLADLTNIEAGLYYNNLNTPSASLVGLVAAFPTSMGVAGLSVTNYGISGVYSELTAKLSFAKKLNKKFNVAVAIDLLQFSQGENLGNKTSFTTELGFQYNVTDKLKVGGHIYNPIRAVIKKDSLATNQELVPTELRVGLNYIFSSKVIAVVEALKTTDESATNVFAIFRVGIDYQLTDMFYIRTGISSNSAKNHFGIGVKKEGLKFDIGVVNQFNLGLYPVFGLSYQIK